MFAWTSDTTQLCEFHWLALFPLACWRLPDRRSAPRGPASSDAGRVSRYLTIFFYRWWNTRAPLEIPSRDPTAVSIRPPFHSISNQADATSISWDDGKEVCLLWHRNLEFFQMRYPDPMVLSRAQPFFARVCLLSEQGQKWLVLWKPPYAQHRLGSHFKYCRCTIRGRYDLYLLSMPVTTSIRKASTQ